MRASSTSIACLAISIAYATPILRRDVAFDFQRETVRGVNIGGWLVLEPWITPSIFQNLDPSVVDEYTLGQKVANAKDILTQHWKTWVSKADFQKIHDAGLNTVRIPIGYWAYQSFGEPYVMGAAEYLDHAIEWARETNLKVWIDLHGAPGSQNGFDNSGHLVGKPSWESGDTIKQTLLVIQQIANQYAAPKYQDVVVAIELLNEPLASALQSFEDLVQFYKDGYGDVRTVSNTPVVLHDAFKRSRDWDNVLSPADATNVIVDHHEYQVFNNDLVKMPPWQHRQLVCNNAGYYSSGANHWVVVGEWTAAMTDCALSLNGRGVGARYDGSYESNGGSSFVGSCATVSDISKWTDTFKNDTTGYIEAQLDVFEHCTQGWIFWNFKTESAAEWDLFRLLDAGVFPAQPTNRKFDPVCKF